MLWICTGSLKYVVPIQIYVIYIYTMICQAIYLDFFAFAPFFPELLNRFFSSFAWILA